MRCTVCDYDDGGHQSDYYLGLTGSSRDIEMRVMFDEESGEYLCEDCLSAIESGRIKTTEKEQVTDDLSNLSIAETLAVFEKEFPSLYSDLMYDTHKTHVIKELSEHTKSLKDAKIVLDKLVKICHNSSMDQSTEHSVQTKITKPTQYENSQHKSKTYVFQSD